MDSSEPPAEAEAEAEAGSLPMFTATQEGQSGVEEAMAAVSMEEEPVSHHCKQPKPLCHRPDSYRWPRRGACRSLLRALPPARKVLATQTLPPDPSVSHRSRRAGADDTGTTDSAAAAASSSVEAPAEAAESAPMTEDQYTLDFDSQSQSQSSQPPPEEESSDGED